jgi:hypothetical protein
MTEVTPGYRTPGGTRGRYHPADCPTAHPFHDGHGFSPGADSLLLGVMVKSNGARVFQLWCPDCHVRVDLSGRQARALDRPAVWEYHWTPNPPCSYQGCGRTDTERHHWAPVNTFGWDDAEHWPQSWLCRDHHRQWHRQMTGYRWMNRGGRVPAGEGGQ